MSDAIRTRIDLLRARARGAEVARTFGRLLAVLALALGGWLACDYWVVTTLFGSGWWDLGMRAALSAALLYAVGRELRRGLWRELKLARQDDELALRLEAAHPQLAGRLISTIQLLRQVAAGHRRRVGSLGLVEALAEETRAQAEAIDHRPAWDVRPARRALAWGLALTAAGLALALWRADIATAFLGRLAFLPAHYPTATRIVRVEVPPLVGRGDPVPIEIEVDPSSQVPEAASARITGADGRASTVRLERVADGGRVLFRGSLKQAVEDIDIRPRAGDHRHELTFAVRVLPRPAVKSLALRLVLPDYLREEPRTSTTGDLQVPVGTMVEVRAVFSRAVTEAKLATAAGLDEATATAMQLADGGTAATGSFTVGADGWWAVGMATAEGLDAGNPPRWTISAIPDRAPSVVATFPPRDKDVTRIARWPIRFTARDDHGLAGVRLRWQIVPPGVEPDAVTEVAAGIDAPGVTTRGAEAVQGEVLFDLARLNPEVGSRIVWWLEARDHRTPEANVGASQRGTFTVLDPAEMRDRMLRERAELIQNLKLIRDRQRDVRDGTEGLKKAAKPGTK